MTAGVETPHWHCAGDHAVQLYRHSKAQALPLCCAPPPAKLAEVAQLSLEQEDWETALAAAQDLAAANPGAAARVVTDVMDAVQTHGGDISVVAAGIAFLHAADQHQDTVKVSRLHFTMPVTWCRVPGFLHMVWHTPNSCMALLSLS